MTPGSMLNDFADGLGYGFMVAIIAFAGLMPREMLQILDLLVGG